MSKHDRRLERLERSRHQGKGEEVVINDGSEYGLGPVDGGWAIFVNDGQPVKALPRELWTAWD